MSDNKVIQSYVWHEGVGFFVSTIERDCSAAAWNGRYNETLVWEFDSNTRQTGKILHQDDGSAGFIGKHLEICTKLFHGGLKELKEETE